MLYYRFSQLKEKVKQEIREMTYNDLILEILSSMFNYMGIEIEEEFIEGYLLTLGMCAFWKLDGKLIVTPCNFIGSIDEYGRGKDLFCVTENGKSETFTNWINNPNVVVMFNNKHHTPDANIQRFASILADTDKSIVNNILNSRYSPIVRAHTEEEKMAYEKAIDNNKDGKPMVVMSANLFTEDDKEEKVVNITDVRNSDKIQYLTKLHDDITRWFYSLYGMSTNGAGKLAQQTTEEINNGNCASFILPYDMLRERKRGISEINRKFGLKANVDFSETWRMSLGKTKSEIDRMRGEINNG